MIRSIILSVLILSSLAITACQYEIQDKVVVITGGAQGIGYGIADKFLANGAATVIILDKNNTKGIEAEDNLKAKYGNKVLFVLCDIATDLYIFDQLIEEYPQIDILVNNAAIIDVNHPRNTITTNVIALIEWSLKFLEHARLDKFGAGGTIVNIGSVVGHWAAPFFPAYIASKYAVVGFSKSLGHAYNYKTTGVRVIAVCPSFTWTPIIGMQIVSTELLGVFEGYRKSQRWQNAADVGARAVEVFKKADTGTSWDIVGGDIAIESPFIEYITIPDEIVPEGTCKVASIKS